MKVAIYMRVSTERQDAENQREELEALCLARKWSAQVTSETESGAKARPLLDEVCNLAARGKVGAVVVWSLDRLGRNAVEVIARVEKLLAANVRVVSLREPWLEQEGPARQLLLFIFAWVAEQERRRLIERTNAGLDKARAKLAKGETIGKTGATSLGRPRADATAVAGAMQAWHDGGESVRSCAKRFGIGEATLRRAIAGTGAEWRRTRKGGPGQDG